MNKLSNLLQNYHKIQRLVDQQINTEKRKKIIILGIPKDIAPDEVKTKINMIFQVDIKENEGKIITKDKAKSYQMMLDLEEHQANKFIKQGRLLVGFISCRITRYLTIRYNRCQLFGHSQDRCRRELACAFCLRKHNSNSCPHKEKIKEHKCI